MVGSAATEAHPVVRDLVNKMVVPGVKSMEPKPKFVRVNTPLKKVNISLSKSVGEPDFDPKDTRIRTQAEE